MPDSFSQAFSQIGFVQAYADILMPRLFEPWARLLVDKIGPHRGAAVADIACGPGTVTREAASRVGPQGRVTGCDFSPAMIDFARAFPASPRSAPIQYKISPAAPLDLPDSSFDVVLCQQGLQFFPDPAASLREMRRVLKPGGKLGVALWSPIEKCPIYFALHRMLAEFLESEQANELKKPFDWPGEERLRTLLTQAGFKSAEIALHQSPLVFEGGIRQCLQALDVTPLGEALAHLRDHGNDGRGNEEVLASAARHLGPLVDSSGAVRSTIESLIAVATAA